MRKIVILLSVITIFSIAIAGRRGGGMVKFGKIYLKEVYYKNKADSSQSIRIHANLIARKFVGVASGDTIYADFMKAKTGDTIVVISILKALQEVLVDTLYKSEQDTIRLGNPMTSDSLIRASRLESIDTLFAHNIKSRDGNLQIGTGSTFIVNGDILPLNDTTKTIGTSTYSWGMFFGLGMQLRMKTPTSNDSTFGRFFWSNVDSNVYITGRKSDNSGDSTWIFIQLNP